MNCYKNITLVMLFLSSAQVLPGLSMESVSDCYGDGEKFKYLEYHFMVKATNQSVADFNDISVKVGVTLLLASLVSKYWKEKSFFNEGHNQILMGLLSSALVLKYTQMSASRAKVDLLYEFLKNWEFHKTHVPVELHAAFDELALVVQSVGKSVLNEAVVNEIFDIVQHLIEHVYPKRYTKDKKGDLLSTVKSLTDIGKNIAPGK